jgi:aspartate/glutamate racemase
MVFIHTGEAQVCLATARSSLILCHHELNPFLLGMLGGMGPLATLDFSINCSGHARAAATNSKFPMWCGMCRKLRIAKRRWRERAVAAAAVVVRCGTAESAGVSHIAIACNTAHHWYEALAPATRTVLHIVDATLALFDGKEKPRRVGIIATQGTLDAGWFQHVGSEGIESVQPTRRRTAAVVCARLLCGKTRRTAYRRRTAESTGPGIARAAQSGWCWPAQKCRLRWLR